MEMIMGVYSPHPSHLPKNEKGKKKKENDGFG
jgi:hypothetical protein